MSSKFGGLSLDDPNFLPISRERFSTTVGPLMKEWRSIYDKEYQAVTSDVIRPVTTNAVSSSAPDTVHNGPVPPLTNPVTWEDHIKNKSKRSNRLSKAVWEWAENSGYVACGRTDAETEAWKKLSKASDLLDTLDPYTSKVTKAMEEFAPSTAQCEKIKYVSEDPSLSPEGRRQQILRQIRRDHEKEVYDFYNMAEILTEHFEECKTQWITTANLDDYIDAESIDPFIIVSFGMYPAPQVVHAVHRLSKVSQGTVQLELFLLHDDAKELKDLPEQDTKISECVQVNEEGKEMGKFDEMALQLSRAHREQNEVERELRGLVRS